MIYFQIIVDVPNAGAKLVTLPKRLEWNEKFKLYVKELDKKKPVIICGDMNVAHQEIGKYNHSQCLISIRLFKKKKK